MFFDAADGTLIAGDHLIKQISSNPLISRRSTAGRAGARALVTYLASLRETQRMPVTTVLPGHGERVRRPRRPDRRAIRHARAAGGQDLGLIAEEPRSAHEIAQAIWGNVAVTQAFLTLSEVLGHVDLLLERGEVVEIERRRRRAVHYAVVDDVEVTLVALLVAVAVLAAAARAINVPYPIVLVIGGAVLGFLGLPEVELDPTSCC